MCDAGSRRSHDHYDAAADSSRRPLAGARRAAALRAAAAAANNAYANRSHFSSRDDAAYNRHRVA